MLIRSLTVLTSSMLVALGVVVIDICVVPEMTHRHADGVRGQLQHTAQQVVGIRCYSTLCKQVTQGASSCGSIPVSSLATIAQHLSFSGKSPGTHTHAHTHTPSTYHIITS